MQNPDQKCNRRRSNGFKINVLCFPLKSQFVISLLHMQHNGALVSSLNHKGITSQSQWVGIIKMQWSLHQPPPYVPLPVCLSYLFDTHFVQLKCLRWRCCALYIYISIYVYIDIQIDIYVSIYTFIDLYRSLYIYIHMYSHIVNQILSENV